MAAVLGRLTKSGILTPSSGFSLHKVWKNGSKSIRTLLYIQLVGLALPKFCSSISVETEPAGLLRNDLSLDSKAHIFANVPSLSVLFFTI